MMINREMLARACGLAQELQDLLRELDKTSLIEPESLGQLVRARELVEEAVVRLGKVRPGRGA